MVKDQREVLGITDEHLDEHANHLGISRQEYSWILGHKWNIDSNKLVLKGDRASIFCFFRIGSFLILLIDLC